MTIKNKVKRKRNTKKNKFIGGASAVPNTNESSFNGKWELPIISTIKPNTPITLSEYDYIDSMLKIAAASNEYVLNCFRLMLQREHIHSSDDYVVFYHSYAYSHILYDVQTAIFELINDLQYDENRLIPRINGTLFKKYTINNIKSKVKTSNARNHNSNIRDILLSAVCSLFYNAEMSLLKIFEIGYSCADLNYSELLRILIKTCFPQLKTSQITFQILYNENISYNILDGYIERPQSTCSRFNGDGRLLQIFIKKTELDKFIYKSKEYGIPNNTSGECSGDESQVRIIANPKYFINSDIVKTYIYYADETNIKKRENFIINVKSMFKQFLTTIEQKDHIKNLINGNS